ncbi:MAG: hydroxyacid dehydrogenase [Clostridia bacterium]|nr:hydroxyacid dehydrogenase [Clostridia bacterium]
MKAIFLSNLPERITYVYPKETIDLLEEIAGVDPAIYTKDDLLQAPEKFSQVQWIFSTWGMPAFKREEIQNIFPNLQCVFYGAGSVQGFARPFLACGVRVFSAWVANAVPVAEFTVAQIILANKGFYQLSALRSRGIYAKEISAIQGKYPGNYGANVGIIGAGMIGSKVIDLLKAYHLPVKVFDPFLSEERAKTLGVATCSLEELFETCSVISNHLANNPQTKEMLVYDHFTRMRPYATFINTGRGQQVREADLVQILQERPDLTAVMDVTWPEPPEEGHPFYQMQNCILTPHIAGSSGREVHRMSWYMVEEFRRMTQGMPCLYEVTEKMLDTMA